MRFEARNRGTPPPPLGQLRCTADGTEISSPLTGRRSVPRFSTIVVPQVGHVSSGRTRPRRVVGAFCLRVFFMVTALVLVERNYHAVAPKEHLDVQDHPGEPRLE